MTSDSVPNIHKKLINSAIDELQWSSGTIRVDTYLTEEIFIKGKNVKDEKSRDLIGQLIDKNLLYVNENGEDIEYIPNGALEKAVKNKALEYDKAIHSEAIQNFLEEYTAKAKDAGCNSLREYVTKKIHWQLDDTDKPYAIPKELSGEQINFLVALHHQDSNSFQRSPLFKGGRVDFGDKIIPTGELANDIRNYEEKSKPIEFSEYHEKLKPDQKLVSGGGEIVEFPTKRVER